MSRLHRLAALERSSMGLIDSIVEGVADHNFTRTGLS